jgi:chemotaxis protein methyltransferase CheR
MMMTESVQVSDEEIASLTQSILTRYGIDFTCYEPKSLKRRIIRVLNLFELTSAHDLWVKFLRDPTFIKTFMNEISVGMTSMFRDPILWKNLKKRLNSEFHR